MEAVISLYLDENLSPKIARQLRLQGPQAVAWEQALNQLVYRLYDLTPAEIALVEQQVT